MGTTPPVERKVRRYFNASTSLLLFVSPLNWRTSPPGQRLSVKPSNNAWLAQMRRILSKRSPSSSPSGHEELVAEWRLR